MSLDQLHKEIESKTISPIYLLYGTETYLIEETKNKIIRTVLSIDEMDFNYSNYDLSETPIQVAVEDAETLPFMGDKRIVVVKDPIFLTSLKDSQKIEHDLHFFESYINNPSPDTVFIIEAFYEKLDDRKKIVKLLKKKAQCVPFKELDEKMLLQWIERRFDKNKVTIDRNGQLKLMQLVGNKLIMLANEIDKISTYVGENEEINEEVIIKMASRTLEQNIFLLIDKVVQKNVADAMRIYEDLLEQKEEPIRILSLISQQIRLISHVKTFSNKGYGQKQIASLLKVHPFRVKLAMDQSKHFQEEELKKLLNDIAEADYQMKTGKMDKKLLLELFFIGMNNDKVI